MNKKYNCGLLHYGSLYRNTINKDYNIIDGPMINVRLSGYAFMDTPKERLTRNFHPLGNLINSSIILFTTTNISNAIKIILHREYYNCDDIEPMCFLKRKEDNTFDIKIPFYNSYLSIHEVYINVVKKLFYELIQYSKTYDLDYIFFISYSHRIDLLHIDNNICEKTFNEQLIKLFSYNSQHLYYNTRKYLTSCDPKTYTKIEKLIMNTEYYNINNHSYVS